MRVSRTMVLKRTCERANEYKNRHGHIHFPLTLSCACPKCITFCYERNVERTQVRVQYDHSRSFYCVYTSDLWAPGRQISYYLYPAIRHDGHATLKTAHNELVREWSLASRSVHSRRTASANHNYRCTLAVFLTL